MAPNKTLVQPSRYAVYEDGPLVKLQVGNNTLPMTWDVALRIAAKIRVYQRDAQEYIGMARTLAASDDDPTKSLPKSQAVREAPVLVEGMYKVLADGPDTVLKVGTNATLTMTPEVARNISAWLQESGKRIQEQWFPDMTLRISVANLTDKTEQDRQKEKRRDGTATFR